MPIGTDFAGFGAIGIPLFVSPVTGNCPQWPATTAVLPGPFRVPLAGSFSLAGTVLTLTDKLDRLQVSMPSSASTIGVATLPIPGAPYTIDFAGCFSSIQGTTTTTEFGICLSDGTKYWTFTRGASSSFLECLIIKWNTTTSSSVVALIGGTTMASTLYFLRITDDGTTRTAYISSNGKDFSKIFSEATNTFLTPTTYGLYSFSNTVGSQAAKASVYNLSISGAILGDAP